MSDDPGSWVRSFPARKKFPDTVLRSKQKKKPDGFTYKLGQSPFESICCHNTILYTLLPLLPTPTLVSLFFVSRLTKRLLTDLGSMFQNLAFLPESDPVEWDKREGFDRPPKYLHCLLGRQFVNFLSPIENGTYDEQVSKETFELWLNETLHGTEAMSDDGLDQKQKAAKYHFYNRLRGGHLYKMITNLPIGRGLTTLIIDGTSADTRSLSLILPRMEGTLRGVSAKWCKHIECYFWSEWIMEAMYKNRPFALKWLSIYGSGNVPRSDFRWDVHPDQLTPLRPNSREPKIPEEAPINLKEWKRKPNLFANLMPFEFHHANTMALITPQNLTPDSSRSFLNASRQALKVERESFKNSDLPTEFWTPPHSSMLNDPHPLIALFAVARFKGIMLDISYCMNGRRCWSFISSEEYLAEEGDYLPEWDDPIAGSPITDAFLNAMRRLAFDDEGPDVGHDTLNTHCVAEIGRRRKMGGRACSNCGLWEDKYSSRLQRGTTPVKNIGGVLTGDSIGIGRISVGNLCVECISNMTCISCNAYANPTPRLKIYWLCRTYSFVTRFFCGSCLFRVTPELPRIPTAVEFPHLGFLSIICTEGAHGPYCQVCAEKHLEVCGQCDEEVCTTCLNPGGLDIVTNMFGCEPEVQENCSFSVLASTVRYGNYGGWDEMMPEKNYFDYSDCESEVGSETSFMDVSDKNENKDEVKLKQSMLYNRQLRWLAQHQGENQVENQKEVKMGDAADDMVGNMAENSSQSSSSSSSIIPSEWFHKCLGFLGFLPIDPESEDIREMFEDPRIIVAIRVSEKCTACGDLYCTECLTYDMGVNPTVPAATGYRSCAGNCGARLCPGCLDEPEFSNSWCPGTCFEWLCSMCTRKKGDVRFMCHPGSRRNKQRWDKGGFSRSYWYACMSSEKAHFHTTPETEFPGGGDVKAGLEETNSHNDPHDESEETNSHNDYQAEPEESNIHDGDEPKEPDSYDKYYDGSGETDSEEEEY
ncbi:hypothetical protein L873DRAFT_1787777 [Choiromyces venosus 120613-1]|uniref:Uncharacterized protein n=1 Tax=Choiromyces venosus 120613-1 TaxID=1336337 RepID=A0A3N4JW39_9PEZI|nr:hypothetical protein L873DRAFT_1787777 [Choiromyces venosus 120613-1]